MTASMVYGVASPPTAFRPNLPMIKELAHGIFTTRPDQIACEEGFERPSV